MVYIHRVVSRLRQLMQDADVSTRHGGRTEDGQTELLLVHRLRAREGKEDASRTNLFESLGIQFLVTLQSVPFREI